MNLGAVMNPDQAQIHGSLQLRFTAQPQYGNSWRRQVGGSQASVWGGSRAFALPALDFSHLCRRTGGMKPAENT